MGELNWQQLPIDTPSTAAFMLNGALTREHVSEFTVNLGRSLQPLPKRLFLDIRGLKQIDRAGIDTMGGLGGLFAENDGGFLAVIGAPEALKTKLVEGAPEGSFRFFASFGHAAREVMDSMLGALSGQFRMLPAKPSITDAMRACWAGITPVENATQVLTLKRSFDKVSSPSFGRHWNAEFSPDARNLIIDVSELRTLVDEGTEWFRRIVETIHARDGRVFLISPQPKVRVMLEMLEMSRLFEEAVSITEAREALR